MINKVNKVAVVQAAPILFDVTASIKKMETLVKEAAKQKAKLVLFPETFISCYPRGLSFGTVVGSRSEEGRKTWLRYWNSGIEVYSKESEAIGKIAKKYKVFLVTGVTERSRKGGTLFCTTLYFSPDGQLIGKHRKIKPTAAERIIWGEGDGTDLDVYDTEIGKIGGLTCWENYMPSARMKLYEQGIELYLAPTADSRSVWTATMQHIALEGRCYVLGSNQYVTKEMYPEDLPGIEDLQHLPPVLCRGGSLIVSPLGQIIAGPLFDEEGILYADISLENIIQSKLDFDVIGHYYRDL
jgi:nitrilase